MVNEQSKPRILILGGGFAGIEAARTLGKAHLANAEVTLISDKDYFEYLPALYRIVTSTAPIEARVPLSELVPKSVYLIKDKVTGIDLTGKKIVSEKNEYSYDYLVIALGSVSTYFNLPGLESLSLGFRSVDEALALKAHLENLFEMHEHPSVNELVSHFHIVIVGAGPTGVEVAGDLKAYMKTLAMEYKVDPSFITIDLIEAGGRILAAFPEDVSHKVELKLRTLGVNIFLNRRLMKEDIEGVYMQDMSLQSKTVIWTAGAMVNPLISETSGLTFDAKKRIVVDEHLNAEGHINVFVAGDVGATPYSGLAQTAIYDGKYVGKAIAARIKGEEIKKYKPKKVGYSLPVGDCWGVFTMGTFRLYGRIAYELRHLIDFDYFLKRLSLKKLVSLYFEGWKYRRSAKGRSH